jgi:UDP:flavonoid glycosyltransferase YjiC (YdhE family)
MLALARGMQRRGHDIMVVALADARAKVGRTGLEFIAFAENEFPESRWSGATPREP